MSNEAFPPRHHPELSETDSSSFQSINGEEFVRVPSPTPKRPTVPSFIRTSYRRSRSLTLSSRGTPVNEKDVQQFLATESLPHSIHAPFDLVGFVPRGPCTPNTRNQILADLMGWGDSGDASSNVAWLHGKAGTGKTTVAYTFCQTLSDKETLGASFFCSHMLPDTSDIELIIPTIAYQLARRHDIFQEALSKALSTNPADHQLSLEGQLQLFIIKPFQAVADQMPTNLVVVVDALEQCKGGHSRFIEAVIHHSLPFKVLLISRPDPSIRHAILAKNDNLVATFDLHKVDSTLVKKDITTFLHTKLSHLPSDDVKNAIPSLVAQSGYLFIYAATVARRLECDREDRNGTSQSLSIIQHPTWSTLEPVRSLYEDVLSHAFSAELSLDDFTHRKNLLHTVICAREPLTRLELASFWDISLSDASHHLDALRSVISVPDNENEVVTIFHGSFLDFITEPRDSYAFCFSAESFHLTLAMHCFKIMNNRLKQDICQLKERRPNSTISSEIITKSIPHGLAYASLYGAEHWVLSGARLTSPPQKELQSFVKEHLLHWLECLSVLGLLPAATGALRVLSAMNWDQNTASIINDTLRVLDLCYEAIEYSSLEVYNSALVWIPSNATLRLSQPSLWRQRGLPTVVTGLPPKWEGAEQYLRNNQSGVNSIAISSDATRIVSGSDDSAVRIWNVMSHRNDHTLTGHSNVVLSVAISPDGRRVASGSPDRTVRIWNIDSHDVVADLQGHTDWVRSVAFSPDGTRVCSSSNDYTIRIWNLAASSDTQAHFGNLAGAANANSAPQNRSQSARRESILRGHTGAVRSAVFSPDGQHIVSGADDRTARIWDLADSSVRMLEEHPDWVTSVAWSPNLHHVATATGNSDKVIRIWSYRDLTKLQELRGHTQTITSIAFSPNSMHLASGSMDQTLRIWSANSGQVLSVFNGHADAVRSVAFFPDGQHVISASSDCSIRIWGVSLEQTDHKEERPDEALKQARRMKSLSGLLTSFKLSHNQPGSSSRQGEALLSIKYVAFSPTGTKFAIASSTTLLVLNGASGAEECRIRGRSPISSITFSPSGRMVASGSSDFCVRIWSTENGKKWCTLRGGHTSWILAMAFSPDGRQIASASADKTIRIWGVYKNFREERTCQNLIGHMDQVQTVSYSEDGQRLVSASADNTIRVWDVSSSTVQVVLPLDQVKQSSTGLSADLYVQSVTFMPGATEEDRFSTAISTLDRVVAWKHDTDGEHFHMHRGFTNLTFCVGGPSSYAGFDDGWVYEWTGHDWSSAPRRSLWIPHQYRSLNNNCTAFSSTEEGRRICLGSEGGRMLLIQLR